MTTVGSQPAKTAHERRVHFRAAVRTDVGRKRTENQDAYGAAHFAGGSLFVVCDGMGGARGGATASALAVNAITRAVTSVPGEITLGSLRRAITISNQIIHGRSQRESDLAGMGTTVVSLAFNDDKVLVAHVGDSRIYLLRHRRLMRLTRDHTLVQELVDTGAIPEEDAASHPIAHMLTRSLGPTDAVEISIHPLPDPVEPGDRFLLCTDGLYNHVDHDTIEKVLSDGDVTESAANLIQLALDGGGSDNVTVQIVEIVPPGSDRATCPVPQGDVVERELSSEMTLTEPEEQMLLEQEPAYTNGADALSGDARPFEEDGTAALDGVVRSAEQKQEMESALLGGGGDPSLRWLPFVAGLVALSAIVITGWVLFGGRRPTVRPPRNPATVTSPSTAATGDVSPPASSTGSPVPDALGTGIAVKPPGDAAADDPKAVPSTTEVQPTAVLAEQVNTRDVKFDQLSTILEPSIDSDKVQAPILEPLSDEMAQVVAIANDLSVPAPPQVQIKGAAGPEKGGPAVPIVWEHESKKLERLTAEADKKAGTDKSKAPAPTPRSDTGLLRTDDEKLEIAEDKQGLRAQIADTDAKLSLLGFESRDEAHKVQVRLEMDLSRTNEAIEALRGQLERANEALSAWLLIKRRSTQTPLLKLANEIAPRAANVKALHAKYTQAARNYFAAVDRWKAEPTDQQAASIMAALGREMNARRAELEGALERAVGDGIAEAQKVRSDTQFDLANLERRTETLNRHIGYSKAFIPLSAQRRAEEVRSLLDARREWVRMLADLQAKLPDAEELELRRSRLKEADNG